MVNPVPAKHLTLKVWVCIFVYAMLTGLAIQLVILPHVFPQLHAGNGLLAGRDWVGFHEQAVVQAQKIMLLGWDEFRLRPDGDNAITGIASFFYVVLTSKPWTLLPLNSLAFATGGVALFSMLKYLELEDNEAILAMVPYAVFPSALLQYGQIHKDVFCTACVLVVLWSWVSLLRGERRIGQIVPVFLAGALALAVLSIFRPYFMFPFLGLGIIILLWHAARVVWQMFPSRSLKGADGQRTPWKFNLTSVLILVSINLFVYLMSVSQIDIRMRPVPSDSDQAGFAIPLITVKSNQEVRSADTVRLVTEEALTQEAFKETTIYKELVKKGGSQAQIAVASKAMIASAKIEIRRIAAAKIEAAMVKAIEECRPVVIVRDGAFFENLVNRAFLKIAVARAGFTSSGGTTAASNIDKGIDFCKNEDLVRYIPRAMQIAMFAPFPSQWMSTEKRNSSAVEIFISSVEMFYCYIAYVGLFYWMFSYKRWTVALLIPISFAVGLTLLLGLTVANVGTLYRMRFPFAMIYVSIGMAGLMQIAKFRPRWVERLDSNGD